MTTMHSYDGKFTTIGVMSETKEKIKRLAGERDIYRVVDELVDRALNGRQGGLGGGTDMKDDSLIARLTHLLGSERGRDVLAKMELAHWDNGLRDAACNALIEADQVGLSDKVLVGLQSRLNEELKSKVPFPSFDAKVSEA